MLLALLIGCGTAGATYAYSKQRQATNGAAAGAAALTGVSSAAVAYAALVFWPLVLLGGVGYLWMRGSGPKALGPGRS
ncbi:hypothetical protein [Nannocystis punicea]|uniref:Uncharacterized protein n=1 Tax=Nannocystis punicea TaxID=2995304 RepID=A0ABY7HA13_9BACT|nr:hypothetical protein [Nannocystis poenicansa]WAS96083.1 hypothetical protein O0S08_07950 [Nannocystis poenicansa]